MLIPSDQTEQCVGSGVETDEDTVGLVPRNLGQLNHWNPDDQHIDSEADDTEAATYHMMDETCVLCNSSLVLGRSLIPNPSG